MTDSEKNLELLEEYLDGALEGGALLDLRKRLATDAQLSAALAELQSHRALRQAAYQAMQPSELAAQQLMWRVRGAMLDQQQSLAMQPRSKWSQWRIASIGSAAAACLVLGFMFGRLDRTTEIVPSGSPITPTSVVSNPAPGITVADNNHPSQFVPVASTPKISVPISDAYGRVVAWQTFDNPEEAKNFTEDLNKAHGESQPVNSVQPTLVDSPQPSQPAKVPF